jgi:glycosyltransferase involved in cell wall biosynthesis/precorrin-6B methylase 2
MEGILNIFMKSLSLVIPAWNEEKNIPPLIQAIKKDIPLLTDDFEVIFIDDASSDATPKLLDDLSKLDARIKVIHNKKNMKLGGSLREGLRIVSKDLVLYLDADLPFDLKEVKRGVRVLEKENADVVSAYRINRGIDGLRRTLYSIVYNCLVDALFHLKLRDINFSFKLFKRRILERISLHSDGSFLVVELLIKAKANACKIAQMPAWYITRKTGRSSLSSFLVIKKIISELITFYFGIFQWYSSNNVVLKTLAPYYENAPFLKKLYLYLRISSCPFDKIEKYVPREGRIVDVGCGMGSFSLFLSHQSDNRDVTAVDWNSDRIAFNMEIAKANNVSIDFIKSNIVDFAIPSCQGIVIIDVLYLIDEQRRNDLLSRCYNKLVPGGTIVIKEIKRGLSLKYAWYLFQEVFMTKIARINQSTGLYHMDSGYVMAALQDAGFKTTMIDCSKGYMYPHWLYIGQKN